MKQFYLLLITCFLISCNKEPAAPALDWTEGINTYNMEFEGTMRNFIIHVPPGFDNNNEVPLLFMLHGTGGDGAQFYNISGWVEKANEENFIVVFPTGVKYVTLDAGVKKTKWSSDGLEKELAEGTEIIDDDFFFRELIRLCASSFNIDEQRVYITGFSNGSGFVKSRVVRDMDDIFAAACASGGLGTPLLSTPSHGNYMPLFNIVGTYDDRAWESLGVTEELPFDIEELFALESAAIKINNQLESMRLSTAYTQISSPPIGNFITFADGPANTNTEYKILMANDLEHKFPNGTNNPQNIKATDFLWDWFMQFELP